MNKEESKQLMSSLIKYFTDKYNIALSGKNSLKFNSSTQTVSQFVNKFITDQVTIALGIGNVEFYRLVAHVKESEKLTSEERAVRFIAEKVYDNLKSHLDKKTKEKVVKLEDSELLAHAFEWRHHIPIMDIKSRHKVMYDTSLKCIDHNTSFSAWKDYVSTLSTAERTMAMSVVISAKVDYDPYSIQEVHYKAVGAQKEVLHVNAHKMPAWRLKPIEKPKLPIEFKQLMDHLFPGTECRKYVLHWLNFMMTSRNHCYLLLHGEQGIGKNTLAAVMEKLVGQENYSYIEPTFWEAHFNAELKFKRCVFLDETVINSDIQSRIRAMTNKHLAITEKGIDTIMYPNHNSYVIANNLDKINQITYDDRRYSVPILGKKPIKLVLGVEWLDRFYELLEDVDFVANIGHWILQNADTGEYNEKQPYITEYFYDIVDKALTGWQSKLIALIESRETSEIVLDNIKEELGGTGRVKVSAFLDNHRDREGDLYGTVTQRHDGVRIIAVNKKYHPDTEFGDDGQEDDEEEEDFTNLEF